MNPLILFVLSYLFFESQQKRIKQASDPVPVKVRDSKENKIYIKPKLLKLNEPQSMIEGSFVQEEVTLEGAVVKQTGKTTVNPKWVDKAMKNNKQNKTESLQ